MIVANGGEFLSLYKIGNSAIEATKTDGTIQVPISTANCAQVYKICSAFNLLDVSSSGGNEGPGMVMNLGVGTTEPTRGDHWLANTTVDGVDVNTLIRCLGNAEESRYNPTYANTASVIYTYSFRSYAEHDITITEIGLSYLCPAGKFLCARKLIPPRTIRPNEVVTFSYMLDFCD